MTAIEALIAEERAEEATGCARAAGPLRLYDDSDESEISHEQAARVLLDGDVVAWPSAGAGSYTELARALGWEVERVLDWTSSAGDWQILLSIPEKGQRVLVQTNRYPYHGFKYTVLSEDLTWDCLAHCINEETDEG
jgi:hypothetical protein